MNDGLIGLPAGRLPVMQPRQPGARSLRGTYWGWGWPDVNGYGNTTVQIGTQTAAFGLFSPKRPIAVRSLMFEVTGVVAAATASVGIVAVEPGRELLPTAGTSYPEAELRCTVIARVDSLSIASAGNVITNLSQELILPPGDYGTFLWQASGSTVTVRTVATQPAGELAMGEALTSWAYYWQNGSLSSLPSRFIASAYPSYTSYNVAHFLAMRWRYLD